MSEQIARSELGGFFEPGPNIHQWLGAVLRTGWDHVIDFCSEHPVSANNPRASAAYEVFAESPSLVEHQ